MTTSPQTTPERSPARLPTPKRLRRWPNARRRLHRAGGLVITFFALLHLGNHLLAWAGVPLHQQALEMLRLLYRQPLVEWALLLVLTTQLMTGTARAWASWRAADPTPGKRTQLNLQAISGLVLGGFLMVHVAAVLAGRHMLQVDTNFYFAAAGLHSPWVWFFAPYYFLGVCALGVHLGCVAQARMPPQPSALRRVLPGLVMVVGLLLAGLLVALMAGGLVEVRIPAHYLVPYQT